MISRYGFQTESIAPSPALAVSEPTISYLVPGGAPESSATQPSAATRLSANVSASMMLMMLMTLMILFLSRSKSQAIG